MWVGDLHTRALEETGRHLLLVGEAPCLQSLETGLQQLGWRVTCAAGAAGIEAALEERPTLVACRVDLAHGADLRVLESMRELRPQVPVVLFSCKASLEDLQSRWRLGAFDIVNKGGCAVEQIVDVLERGLEEGRRRLTACQQASMEAAQIRRGLERQRLELRHLRRKSLQAEAQLQVAIEVAEDDSEYRRLLELALAAQREEVGRTCRGWATLLRDVGDEIRHPLDRIVDGVNHLLDEEVGRGACEQALEICSAARQLAVLVRDLSELAEVEDGSVPVHLRRADVLEFLTDVASTVQRLTGVEVALRVRAGVSVAVIDIDKMRCALIHLLAVVADLPKEGPIHFEATAEDGAVLVRLWPLRAGAGTWRTAELLRQQGGSLAREEDALLLRVRAMGPSPQATLVPDEETDPVGVGLEGFVFDMNGEMRYNQGMR